jgi:hypothetical protein
LVKIFSYKREVKTRYIPPIAMKNMTSKILTTNPYTCIRFQFPTYLGHVPVKAHAYSPWGNLAEVPLEREREEKEKRENQRLIPAYPCLTGIQGLSSSPKKLDFNIGLIAMLAI